MKEPSLKDLLFLRESEVMAVTQRAERAEAEVRRLTAEVERLLPVVLAVDHRRSVGKNILAGSMGLDDTPYQVAIKAENRAVDALRADPQGAMILNERRQ